MLTLNEFIQIEESITALLEGELTEFSEEQIDAAEFYDLKWNPISFNTELHIYNVDGEPLGSIEFDDPDVAIEYVEWMFDLDEDDLYDLESYAWAEDITDRENQTIQDD